MTTTDLPQQARGDWDALQKKFMDFDLQEVYNKYKVSAVDKASNFVVKFGRDHARIAVNLTKADFELLLTRPDPDCPARWM
jgi:hypothetical protein